MRGDNVLFSLTLLIQISFIFWRSQKMKTLVLKGHIGKEKLVFIVPILFLFLSVSAFSGINPVYVEGSCAAGKAMNKWWSVHHYDDNGDLICSSGANCDNEGWTTCSGSVVGDPIPPGITDNVIKREFEIVKSGGVFWTVKEKNSSGDVVVRWDMLDNGDLWVTVKPSGSEIHIDPEGHDNEESPTGGIDLSGILWFYMEVIEWIG